MNEGVSIWTSQNFSVKKDVVILVIQLGKASAQSAGEKRTNEKDKNRFKKIGHLLKDYREKKRKLMQVDIRSLNNPSQQ